MLSNVAYRVKFKSSSPTASTSFEWMPFIPKVSFEFSVPNEQSEIDAILDAVQGGKNLSAITIIVATIQAIIVAKKLPKTRKARQRLFYHGKKKFTRH